MSLDILAAHIGIKILSKAEALIDECHPSRLTFGSRLIAHFAIRTLKIMRVSEWTWLKQEYRWTESLMGIGLDNK